MINPLFSVIVAILVIMLHHMHNEAGIIHLRLLY